jgi:LacI family transcriptional regulator
LSSERFFAERMRSFTALVNAAGCPCAELPEETSDTVTDWEKNQDRLIKRIAALPKPVGIFAANDQLGVRLLDACQRAHIAVPAQVAVVGAENEETLCSFSTPALSSVQFNGVEVGYRAAQMLDSMMTTAIKPLRVTLIPPKALVVRESSDDLVISDQLVVQAARLIREQATAGISVKDLCRILKVSRSTLERRMAAALQVKPKDEILRIRFREAERLLRDSELTIDTIAKQTGFTESRYLQTAFKDRYGQTPGAFRLSHRH